MLPEKPCAFPLVYERHADPVGLTFQSATAPSTDYQKVGNTWDRAQLRKGNYEHRPHTFSSIMPRAGQLVGYAGEIATAGEPSNKDNPFVDLSKDGLLSKVRTIMPGQTFSSASPHMPGYTGHYVVKPATQSRLSSAKRGEETTSGIVHR